MAEIRRIVGLCLVALVLALTTAAAFVDDDGSSEPDHEIGDLNSKN